VGLGSSPTDSPLPNVVESPPAAAASGYTSAAAAAAASTTGGDYGTAGQSLKTLVVASSSTYSAPPVQFTGGARAVVAAKVLMGLGAVAVGVVV
jgi:hypothetical protein